MMVGFLVWGSTRGLDVTDEGFIALTYLRVDPDFFHHTDLSWLIPPILGWLEPGIVGFRLLRLVLLLTMSWVFSRAFQGWCESRLPSHGSGPGPAAVTAFLGVGALTGFCIDPPILSYNTINVALSLVVASVLLHLMTPPPPPDRYPRGLVPACLAAGAALGLQYFVKFPTSFLLAFFMGSLLLVDPVGRATRRRSLPSLLAGLALGVGAVFTFLLDFDFFASGSREATRYLTAGVYRPSTLILSYLECFLPLIGGILLRLAPFFVGVVVFVSWLEAEPTEVTEITSLPRRLRHLGEFLLFYLVAVFLLAGYSRGGNADPPWTPGSSWILLLGLGFTLVASRRGRAGTLPPLLPLLPTLAFLLLVPYIGMIGTSNKDLAQVVHFLPAWYALLLAMALLAEDALRLRGIRSAVMILGCVFSGTLFLGGYGLHPFRVTGSLFDQTETVDGLPRIARLRLDPATAAFFRRLDQEVRSVTGYRPGDPIFAFYHLPGVVYALGGRSPGCSWFNSHLEPGFVLSHLDRVPLSDLSGRVVLRSLPIHPTLLAGFARRGLTLRKVAEMEHPFTFLEVDGERKLEILVFDPAPIP